MALPFSRNITLSPSDPVPSSLLNDLQDSIVGSKHANHEIPIAACDFTPESGSSANLGSNGQWSFSAVSTLVAPCRVRAQERINSILFEYNRGGAGTIVVSLVKRIAGSGVVTVVSTASITTGTGLATTTITPNYQVAAGEQVYMRVEVNNAANIFVRAAMTTSTP